jgi:hypothetical protein
MVNISSATATRGGCAKCASTVNNTYFCHCKWSPGSQNRITRSCQWLIMNTTGCPNKYLVCSISQTLTFSPTSNSIFFFINHLHTLHHISHLLHRPSTFNYQLSTHHRSSIIDRPYHQPHSTETSSHLTAITGRNHQDINQSGIYQDVS